MVFGPDTDGALVAAVALVNSAEPPDTLTGSAQLDAFYDEHHYSGARPSTPSDLDAVRALRTPLRALLTADRDTAAGLVNDLLARYASVPRLVRHDALDWHVHAVDDEAPFAHRIAVESAMAVLDMVRADEMSRLSLCADPTCDGVLLDLSRNRSRRFCSTTCGNRMAVAAYRARRA